MLHSVSTKNIAGFAEGADSVGPPGESSNKRAEIRVTRRRMNKLRQSLEEICRKARLGVYADSFPLQSNIPSAAPVS